MITCPPDKVPAREHGTRKGAWHPQGSMAPARGATAILRSSFAGSCIVAREYGTRKGCHYYTMEQLRRLVYSSERACPSHGRAKNLTDTRCWLSMTNGMLMFCSLAYCSLCLM